VSGRWGKLAWTVALSRCYNMSIDTSISYSASVFIITVMVSVLGIDIELSFCKYNFAILIFFFNGTLFV